MRANDTQLPEYLFGHRQKFVMQITTKCEMKFIQSETWNLWSLYERNSTYLTRLLIPAGISWILLSDRSSRVKSNPKSSLGTLSKSLLSIWTIRSLGNLQFDIPDSQATRASNTGCNSTTHQCDIISSFVNFQHTQKVNIFCKKNHYTFRPKMLWILWVNNVAWFELHIFLYRKINVFCTLHWFEK